MKSSEQIKGAIKNISKKTGVNPNSLLQMCLFEGILEKISKSNYSSNFIIKGGLLISSLIGIDMRTTMDMDTTIKGLPVKENILKEILIEILNIDINSSIKYELIKLSRIREKDIYEDFSASILCSFGKIKANLNIDITTGDVITPREMKYFYPKIFENEKIPIMTYTLETIIAEKFETISKRNLTTTRAKDFYDLYMLYKLYNEKINYKLLKDAIIKTAKKRNSLDIVLKYKEILELFKVSKTSKTLWERYKTKNPYVKGLDFFEVLNVYEQIGKVL